MTRDLWLVVFGAGLAFSGGLLAFFIQWWWNRKIQRKVVHDFLRELLRAFDRVAPRIVETYQKSGILWNDLLNQVSNDLALYERNREYAIVIKDLTIRAELWDWFSKLRTVIHMSLGLNAMLITRPGDPWATGEVKKQVDQIKELKVEAQRLLERLQ